MTNELPKIPEWLALQTHFNAIRHMHMRDWFKSDSSRFNRYSLQFEGILLDYSRNRILDETLDKLFALAKARHLPEKIAQLFKGDPINNTEKRAVLHTALRDPNHTPLYLNGHDIAQDIHNAQEKLKDFVTAINNQSWKGVTGKPIQHVVNIGIGGSYIGPMMCIHALKDFAVNKLQFHFVSTVDKVPLQEVMQQIDPETTLFIISSKSFSTIETLTNANTFLNWMRERLGNEVLAKHFVAVTAKADKAIAYGIPSANIFPLWDWVGGRYSVWSSIALPIMLMLGSEQFSDFLSGAYNMDQHFQHAPYAENMPVILALLGIWYMNFFGTTAQAIVPYAHRLRYFIPYIQQVEMESNGKRIRMNGEAVSYSTSPIIFGEEGCRGQHAYHQLLHQGQHLVPVDFILTNNSELNQHDDILMASALSQAQALMHGKTKEEAYAELINANYTAHEAAELANHQVIPGNRPCNILFLEKLTPKNLGALIALYEHRIFVQGIIWDINSFDQWGVELGKQILPTILKALKNSQSTHLDDAMTGLLQYVRKK